ncbi:MAG TPA: hypothetical protein VHA33_02185 [Candidatus Angelobacter sp.]|jgi:hypothetical protein|nr:hypothetical protein [Candidatus Angelobacter sp.]
MPNAIQLKSGPARMVCMKCHTVQDSSATIKNEPVCAKGHQLRTLAYLQLWSKLMSPFGFVANLGTILLPLLLASRFGNSQQVEFIFWAIYGSSIVSGLIGFMKSRLLYERSRSGGIFFSESRLRFYEGWLCSATMILTLLIFGFAVETFARNHPFIMQG